MVDVKVPSGTRMRTGMAGPGGNGMTGGGQQYQLLENLPESNYNNVQPLKK